MQLSKLVLRLATLVALLVGAMSWVASARADGLSDLESFLRQAQQGRARFTQVVTAPQKAGEAAPRAKTSSGSFEFLRPGRFRFHYQKPFEQQIVADGQTLWLYDVDLNQVTARRQQEALGNTPAALIATASDLKSISGLFTLANAPDADGQQWVLAMPKLRDGQLQSVRIGFRQGQLATLEMLDSFGQRSLIQFGALETQAGLKPASFAFQPPAGADVLRQ